MPIFDFEWWKKCHSNQNQCSMENINSSCACPIKKKKNVKKGTYSLFSSVLIALIPKCPYCILAYSSTITMCSGARMDNSPELGWPFYLTIGLALLTLLFLFINYRGKRTVIAAFLVGMGSLLVLNGAFYGGSDTGYVLGTILLLVGVWVNASFMFIYQTWISPLLNKTHTSSILKTINRWPL